MFQHWNGMYSTPICLIHNRCRCLKMPTNSVENAAFAMPLANCTSRMALYIDMIVDKTPVQDQVSCLWRLIRLIARLLLHIIISAQRAVRILLDSSSVTLPSSGLLSHPKMHGPKIKHIPKSARPAWCGRFEHIYLKSPESTIHCY